MNDKEILNKIAKIASKQQKMLRKLAQEINEAAIEKIILDFVKSQIITWGIPHNITAKETIDINKISPQNYEVNVLLNINNKEDIHVVEDPQIGFAKNLQEKLLSADPGLKNIKVKFNVDAQ